MRNFSRQKGQHIGPNCGSAQAKKSIGNGKEEGKIRLGYFFPKISLKCNCLKQKEKKRTIMFIANVIADY